MLLYFEKNVNAAIKRFRAEIAEDPKYADAHRYGLVLALTEARRVDKAQRELDMLLAKNPDRITYLVAQSELWLAAGKPKKSIEMLSRQLEYNPNNHPLTMSYYKALLLAGDKQRAGRVLAKHTELRPSDPQLWYELAEIRGLSAILSACTGPGPSTSCLWADPTRPCGN